MFRALVIFFLVVFMSAAVLAETKGIPPSLLARAKAGDARAQIRVGSAYAQGKGVSRNFGQAAAWYRKAAVQGDPDAEAFLGMLYHTGDGVPHDDLESVLWFRKAAEQGEQFAQFSLGIAYEYGRGVPQDYAQAAIWYRKSAEQGNADGQYSLARLILDGQGAPQDVKAAMSWFEKAADQGDAESQYMLGQTYEDGGVGTMIHESEGTDRLAPPKGDNAIPKDYSLAVLWFRKAAEQGHTESQSHLGRLYEDGTGVPQDYSEAYFWANLAAATGSSLYDGKMSEYLTADRDRIAAHLTRTDLARVQERTSKWFAAHQPRTQ